MKILRLSQTSFEGVSHNPEIRKQVMLRQGDVPHLLDLSRSVLQPGQVASSHAHADMHEVFFVVSGSGVIRTRDGETSVDDGTCIHVEPGEPHEIANTGRNELVLIYFGIEE